MSEQGIFSCNVTLEVSGYMYLGSGLQIGTGGSLLGLNDIGKIFYIETERQIKRIFTWYN